MATKRSFTAAFKLRVVEYADIHGKHQAVKIHRVDRTTTALAINSGYTMILQLAPILILILLSLLSSLFVSDPVFSMQRTSKYTTERTTQNLRIPYYVKPDFHPEYKGELRRIERSVEEEFISQMRSQCWRERAEKENMMWRARNFGDAKLYQRAQEKPTPSCDRLQQIYS